MSKLSELVNFTFVYCTDFIINLANLFNWSYYEFNVLIFCFIYPLFLFGLLVLFFVQIQYLNQMSRLQTFVF